MHPLLNLPLIHHCLNELKDAGVEEAIIVTHPDKKTLENYFADHTDLKNLLSNDGKQELVDELKSIENLPKVTFAYQHEQLGLAHAILSAEKEIAGRDFYVLLPDEIFFASKTDKNPSIELQKQFSKTGNPVISLTEVDEDLVSQYGVADVEKTASSLKINALVEKPKKENAPSNLVSPGRYLMKAEILNHIKNTAARNGEVQFTDSMMMFDILEGVVTSCPRFDGGTVEGFLKANIYAALQDPKLKESILSVLK